MENLIVFLSVSAIIIASVLLAEWDERQEKKECEVRRIKNIQKYVIQGFKDIEDDADRFGNDFSTSLLEFADKMDKMSSLKVRNDLRPYDIYNVKKLSNSASTHALGRIVVDKNRIPKFMATAPNEYTRDIELEVALTSDEVKELADKCRKIAMDKEIEKFRKDKVNKLING